MLASVMLSCRAYTALARLPKMTYACAGGPSASTLPLAMAAFLGIFRPSFSGRERSRTDSTAPNLHQMCKLFGLMWTVNTHHGALSRRRTVTHTAAWHAPYRLSAGLGKTGS